MRRHKAVTYDPDGNLTSDGSTNFTYDVENRLVAASGSRTAALRYDPLGRLYEVTGPSGWTRFLYDGDALVEEYIATGIAHVYVHGSNAGAWNGGGRPASSTTGLKGPIKKCVAMKKGECCPSSVRRLD